MKKFIIAGAGALALVSSMSVTAHAENIKLTESATSEGKVFTYNVPFGESLSPLAVAEYGSYYVLCSSTGSSVSNSVSVAKVLKVDTVNNSVSSLSLGTSDTISDATSSGKYFCILTTTSSGSKVYVVDMSSGSVSSLITTKAPVTSLAKLVDGSVTLYYTDGTTEVLNLDNGTYGDKGTGLGVRDFDRSDNICFTPKFTATAAHLNGKAFVGTANGVMYLYIKDNNNMVPPVGTAGVPSNNTNNGGNSNTNNGNNTNTTTVQTQEQAKQIIESNYKNVGAIIGNSISENSLKTYLMTGVSNKDVSINVYNQQITKATSSKKGNYKCTAIVSSSTNEFTPIVYNINQTIAKLNSSSSSYSSSSSSSSNATDDMNDAEDKVKDFLDDYNPSNKSDKSNILEALKKKVKKYDVKLSITNWDLDEADKEDDGNLQFTVRIRDDDDRDNYIEVEYDEDFDYKDKVDSIDKNSSSSSDDDYNSSSSSSSSSSSGTSSSSSTVSRVTSSSNSSNASTSNSTSSLISNTTVKKGWVNENGKWCYFENGSKAHNKWMNVSGVWYYMDNQGNMLTGWQHIDGSWYFLNDSGGMVTGWQQLGGYWYFMDSSGKMVNGWQQMGSKWYYFDSSGHMTTGWMQVNSKWYYFDGSGSMVTGWKLINGKWYYLDSSGKMLSSTTIGGYKLGSNGAMV